MTKIGMRELMSDDEGKLRVGARYPQDARMDDDSVAGREGIATHQNPDGLLAVVAHKSANPSGCIVARHGFIVECQKMVPRFDSPGGSRRGFRNRQDGRLRPAH